MTATAHAMTSTPHRDGRFVRLGSLLGLPVRVGGVTVGCVEDVLLNRVCGHVLGVTVRSDAAITRFLPWVGAIVDDDAVRATSVFSLLSSTELVVYLDNGLALRDLDGYVTDVVVGPEGDVAALVTRSKPQRLPG